MVLVGYQEAAARSDDMVLRPGIYITLQMHRVVQDGIPIACSTGPSRNHQNMSAGCEPGATAARSKPGSVSGGPVKLQIAAASPVVFDWCASDPVAADRCFVADRDRPLQHGQRLHPGGAVQAGAGAERCCRRHGLTQ